jgi:hypothetical protein
MQVLSRMREAFKVELSPRLLYTGEFTVAGLSKAVLTEQIRQANPSDINTILRELEALSDDEVRLFLAGSEDEKAD